MEAKELENKLTDILNNYCYCSLFNKPLDIADKLVSHLIVMVNITTRNCEKTSGISKMSEGFEMPFLSKRELFGEKLKIELSKVYQKLKKEFAKLYADGFLRKKIETPEFRVKFDLKNRKDQSSKIKNLSKKELLAYYKGKVEAELLYRWIMNGFEVERKSKNYIYLKAPILEIEPIKSVTPGFRNIKEILNTVIKQRSVGFSRLDLR